MPNSYDDAELKTLEHKQMKGYKKYPVVLGEFDDFYKEQTFEKL
ncbi:MAG: hypothetical protein ACRCYY_03845 [Trueperaceae bacterium]